jgi:hypothetical protein
MAQANLTENLSEMVTKALKKTEIFEKILKIEFYVGSFVLISTLMGITTIYMNFSNKNNIDTIKQDICENERVVKYNIESNHRQNLLQYDNLKSEFFILNKKISELIEHQQNIINQLEEIKSINKSEEHIICNHISTSTSMSSFSPIKITNTIFEDVRDHEYDELLNECYDTIPLNNLKKNTGLSWIFK